MGFISFPIIVILIVLSQNSTAYAFKDNLNIAKNQEVNIGNGEEPSTFDPQKCSDVSCLNIVAQLFEGLVRKNKNGDIIPACAKNWIISPDYKKYTFFLRNHLKWSDGSELTASDFVYSFRRLVDPKIASERASIFENVLNGKEIILGKKPIHSLGVKALNKNTIVLELNKPIPELLQYLSLGLTYPVKEENVKKYGQSFTQPGKLVSNGSFSLSYRKYGDKITIQKNNYYWNHKDVLLNKVNFYPILDRYLEFRKFETGELDITFGIPVNYFHHIKKEYPNEFINHPMLGAYSYIFNNQKPPFNNQKTRLALSIAIDREAISNIVIGMGEKALYDVVPYGVKNYSQGQTYWQNWSRERQIKEAKRLYKEAGYSEKSPLQFNILFNSIDQHRKVANAIAIMLKKNLGVVANLVNVEWNVLINKLRNSDFEFIRMGKVASINDASDFLFYFRKGDPENSQKYSNPKFDLLVNQATTEMNQQKRKNLLEEADRILLEDAPILPIYSFASAFLLKSYIANFKKDPMNNSFSLIGVYLKDKIVHLN